MRGGGRRLFPILFALLVGALAVALRAAVPVAPVDAAFRDVIRFHRSLERS